MLVPHRPPCSLQLLPALLLGILLLGTLLVGVQPASVLLAAGFHEIPEVLGLQRQ